MASDLKRKNQTEPNVLPSSKKKQNNKNKIPSAPVKSNIYKLIKDMWPKNDNPVNRL